MTEEALAIRIRRIGVSRPAICGEVEKMRSTLENRRQKDGVAGRVADGGANSRWLGISQSRQCRGLSRRRRLGSRHGKETKGASSGSRAIPEAAIALLRQAATCDKPLTSLLRRRERSASQDVVGQRAGWVSEHTLGQDMSLTHAVRHHRFTLAVPHRLLPLDTFPVTGSVFLGPVLSIVDCRLSLAACRRPLVAWSVATPSIRAIRAIRAQPPKFAPGPGYEGCLYRIPASGAREYCVPG
jgi:hypothetical protein